MIYDGVIQGKTIRLRSVEEKDAEATFIMRTDPVKSVYLHPIDGHGTIKDQLLFIKKQKNTPMDYLFIIEDLKGAPIGMKGLYSYNKDENMITSGRFLGFGNQIQNIESLNLSYDFAFSFMKVKKILMSTYADNVQMLNIQKRFGAEFVYRIMTAEGRENLYSILTKAKYLERKFEIDNLISRFAYRG